MGHSKTLALINELMKIHPKGYDLSLGRIRRLLAKFDNPQDRLPPTIHVAGTNGKGSTIALCRAMLEADGRLVHVHTSPHLVNYHERFRLAAKGGGRFVADGVLADALRRVADANGGAPITIFEILIVATFLLFSENPADVALIEVGLGGRFDATNVITSPRICVVTPVSLDHERFLGSKVEAIAGEKAGIIKNEIPVVIAEQSDVTRAVLEQRAVKIGAPVIIGGQDFSHHQEHGRFVYQDENGLLDLPFPGLPGQHQFVNAATAIAALRYGGFEPSTGAIEQGLKNVSWPGRLQRLGSGKLLELIDSEAELWLDGGHNPGAGMVISEFVSALQKRFERPLFLVFGMLTSKDPVGYFNEFAGLVEHMYAVPIVMSDAGFDPQELAELASKNGIVATAEKSVSAALKAISTRCRGKTAPRILICGSLYLAGEVLDLNGTPPE